MGLTAFEHVKSEQSAFTPPDGIDFEIVPFGIYHVDATMMMGVMPTDQQIFGIQGIEGSRKTSLALNLITNQCISGMLPEGHLIVVDVLEAGMPIERYLTTIRLILATKYIIYKHHFPDFQEIEPDEDARFYLRRLFAQSHPTFEMGEPEEIIAAITYEGYGQRRIECELKYDLIRRWYFGKWNLTSLQRKAWMIAGDALAKFPLVMYGPSGHYNNEIARIRNESCLDIEKSFERWKQILDGCESAQFWIDHIAAYDTGHSDDYSKKNVVVAAIKRFTSDYGCTFWALDQEGMSNRRDFDRTGEALGGRGGSALKGEANTHWRLSYPQHKDPYHLILHRPMKTRSGSHPDLKLMIEPNSGAIFGKSKLA